MGTLENREALIVLNSLSGIGPIRTAQMLSVLGEPRAVLKASENTLAAIPGIGEVLAHTVAHWEKTVDLSRELALTERAGIRILTRDDPEYPARLKEIHDPPLCLYVRGPEGALLRLDRSLAMVGSRRTTLYGVAMAENLAGAAARAGWTVVSGLARGIDTVAHQAVVDVHGCTVAILGSGMAHIYPQDNVVLARKIMAEGGAIVSEFPMLYPPDKRSFPMRNRIIAGMTLGTVVVEAGFKSGSLITANQALEQGRLVFAVPGQVSNPQSRGCHALIKDGAKLVETFSDILEEFEALPGLPRAEPAEAGTDDTADGSADSAPAKTLPPVALTDLERRLVERLRDWGEAPIDDLIAILEEPASKVLAALLCLEMKHVVSQLPGRRATLRRALG